MTTSVFDHPWLSGLFGDDEITAHLAAEAELARMIAVEAAYARAKGAAGLIEADLAETAATGIETSKLDISLLRSGTTRDGVVVPAFVRTLKSGLPEQCRAVVHTGLTSQDIVDTSLALMLRSIVSILDTRLHAAQTALDGVMAMHGANQLMGRTRMQAALPITVSDRLRTWKDPLVIHAERLAVLKPRLLVLQLGGPVGDRKSFGSKADVIASSMAVELNLTDPGTSWQVQRDGLAEFSNWLSLVTGTLGKMGQDVALMAQQGIGEIVLAGGGGSSAMPHKLNPVQAELLITLARFNAVQLSGMHHALVHEQERSGVAWSLEWMILPQMIMATGNALQTAISLAGSIEHIGAPKG